MEIVSTGGTQSVLNEAGIEVRRVEDLTGFPEILDGRVKTLHPNLHAALLAIRDNPEHAATLREREIEQIDLVCVNLYPFERTVARLDVPEEEAIENIDVGGPTMIRAAAKNHRYVAVVVRPESYDAVLGELEETGELSAATRHWLANEAFAYTARYDAAISRWFGRRYEALPTYWVTAWEKELDLSYGENPHQRAALYVEPRARSHVLSRVAKLHGRPLSFNNVLDLNSARALLSDLEGDGCVIVKHNNPCGVAEGESIERGLRGGVRLRPAVGVRRRDRAQPPGGQGAGRAAPPAVHRGPDRARLRGGGARGPPAEGGDPDPRGHRAARAPDRARHQAGPGRDPGPGPRRHPGAAGADGGADQDPADRGAVGGPAVRLAGGSATCARTRSSSPATARTLGIGAGQMSRVDSVRLAIEKAKEARGPDAETLLAGSVIASDAFFPFADGPQAAIDVGATAVIQPGGSKRDAEVIEACDAAGVAMVFTKRRHFRH